MDATKSEKKTNMRAKKQRQSSKLQPCKGEGHGISILELKYCWHPRLFLGLPKSTTIRAILSVINLLSKPLSDNPNVFCFLVFRNNLEKMRTREYKSKWQMLCVMIVQYSMYHAQEHS